MLDRLLRNAAGKKLPHHKLFHRALLALIMAGEPPWELVLSGDIQSLSLSPN